ncbi:MAG: putative manganese-dependent inorganic diphosphatase [Lachnospiraceae bacterium]|nr:putative manganese-dependent inorganic diphosphatase [Lachnospiraceae bacterium]
MGLNQEKKVWIIGHKNPDTDSICAAIAYADLKNKTESIKHEAKRAGNINEETRYVLEHFQVEEPELVSDVGAQIKDISFRRTAGVSDSISLKRAWELMKTENVVTLPITNSTQKLRGLIVTSDIATSYMDVYDNHILATAKTPYKNIIDTLEGTVYAGNAHAYFMKGKVVAALSTPEWMDEYVESDDLVILGDRVESQMKAIELNASCLVICYGFAVTKEVIEAANKRDCVIIGTPYDTFTVSRLLNQSMPIKYFMTRDNLIQFDIDDYVDDVKETMSKIRHRDFPIVDEENNYVGMISRRNLLNTQKKKIILVDHNEKEQAVDGIGGAEILEIVDHHRLGSLETISPVFFRNQPLGCTSTIIFQMYREKGVEIEPKIAGLLCAAIISDTLMFRSPTCTAIDRAAAEELAIIAGIDIEVLAKNMFRAGSDFNRKTAEEIFYQDFKTFTAGECEFGVAQLSAMSRESLESVQEKLKEYIDTVRSEQKLDMVFVMLTDIIEESTILMSAGEEAEEIIAKAFTAVREADGYLLKGVVSRKKQLIPALMAVMQE